VHFGASGEGLALPETCRRRRIPFMI
jgi:hypothetical protein